MTYEEAVRHLDAYADATAADPAYANFWVGWAVWRVPTAEMATGRLRPCLPWKVSIGMSRDAYGATREAAVIHAGEVLERRLLQRGSYSEDPADE